MIRFLPDESLLKMVRGQRVGVRRVAKAAAELGIDLGKTAITSRDPNGQRLMRRLRVRRQFPRGLVRWQLPQAPDCKHALFFLDYLYPGARIPRHRHRDNTLRVVVSGSLIYKGLQLSAGDWLYVPKRIPYALAAGASGALCHVVWYDEIPPEFL